MSRQVVRAQLHTGFFVPGMGNHGGNFADTLPPSNKTLPEFQMFLQDSGSLLCTWIEDGYKKSFEVGAANVRVALLPPEKIAKSSK